MATVGVNKVIIIGTLGRDPEIRYTQGGTAVASLRLAMNERRKDGDGWKDHTEWITAVAFGKTAENAAQYLSKGRSVYVEGRLQTKKYTGKDGVEREGTEVAIYQLTYLPDGGGERGERPQRVSPLRTMATSGNGAEKPGDGFIDDDLPF